MNVKQPAYMWALRHNRTRRFLKLPFSRGKPHLFQTRVSAEMRQMSIVTGDQYTPVRVEIREVPK